MRNIHTDKPEHEDDIYTGDLKDISELQEKEPYLNLIWKLNKPDFFKQFALLFLSLADTGKITRQTAAYKIAGWMFYDDLMAIPEIEAILMLAGELELPYAHAIAKGGKASYMRKWRKLQKMIQRLIIDVTFFCTNCNNPYLFTVEEQIYYASQEITCLTERCPPCRDLHKKQVDHSIACEVCGTE